jgi:hypothetical protein
MQASREPGKKGGPSGPKSPPCHAPPTAPQPPTAREDEYDVNYVYGPESTNADVASRSVVPLVRKLLEGYNVAVFAFGATGKRTYCIPRSLLVLTAWYVLIFCNLYPPAPCILIDASCFCGRGSSTYGPAFGVRQPPLPHLPSLHIPAQAAARPRCWRGCAPPPSLPPSLSTSSSPPTPRAGSGKTTLLEGVRAKDAKSGAEGDGLVHLAIDELFRQLNNKAVSIGGAASEGVHD